MEPYDSMRAKVAAIFKELAGERAERLSRYPMEIDSLITLALCEKKEPTENEYMHWTEVAHNLVDWNYDAAFLVALHLFPERFTHEEIRNGIGMLLDHVPDHVTEAARLAEQLPPYESIASS